MRSATPPPDDMEAHVEDEDYYCDVCGESFSEEGNWLLLCDGRDCDGAYHTLCLSPMLAAVPEGNWFCPQCSFEPTGRGVPPANSALNARQRILKQPDCGTCSNCLDKPKFGGPYVAGRPGSHVGYACARLESRLRLSAYAPQIRRQACKLKVAQLKRLPPKAKGVKPRTGLANRIGASVESEMDAEMEEEEEAVTLPSREDLEANSIEKILDVRNGTAGGAGGDAEGGAAGFTAGSGGGAMYLCKYRGLAHIHSRWLSRDAIVDDGKVGSHLCGVPTQDHRLTTHNTFRRCCHHMRRLLSSQSKANAHAALPWSHTATSQRSHSTSCHLKRHPDGHRTVTVEFTVAAAPLS